MIASAIECEMTDEIEFDKMNCEDKSEDDYEVIDDEMKVVEDEKDEMEEDKDDYEVVEMTDGVDIDSVDSPLSEGYVEINNQTNDVNGQLSNDFAEVKLEDVTPKMNNDQEEVLQMMRTLWEAAKCGDIHKLDEITDILILNNFHLNHQNDVRARK